MATPELFHFQFSHYNEKARWALDLKGVSHERVSLLPGPHAPRMKRLTGRTQTPVLVNGEEVVAGSAAPTVNVTVAVAVIATPFTMPDTVATPEVVEAVSVAV